MIGTPALADDARYASNDQRVVNRTVLVPLLAAAIRAFRRDELLAKLEAVGVPAGPINTIAEVFAEPQVIHRGMRIDLPAGDGRMVPSIRSPFVMGARR